MCVRRGERDRCGLGLLGGSSRREGRYSLFHANDLLLKLTHESQHNTELIFCGRRVVDVVVVVVAAVVVVVAVVVR